MKLRVLLSLVCILTLASCSPQDLKNKTAIINNDNVGHLKKGFEEVNLELDSEQKAEAVDAITSTLAEVGAVVSNDSKGKKTADAIFPTK